MNFLLHPEHFLFLSKSPDDIFEHYLSFYNTPTIAIGRNRNEEKLFSKGVPEYHRSCELFMAMDHITSNLKEGRPPNQCPHYPNACIAQKGNYCLTNPLWAPLQKNKGCIMAYAAHTLSASHKGPEPQLSK